MYLNKSKLEYFNSKLADVRTMTDAMQGKTDKLLGVNDSDPYPWISETGEEFKILLKVADNLSTLISILDFVNVALLSAILDEKPNPDPKAE